MKQLQNTQPDQYQRLKELQQDDPIAFRDELRKKIRSGRKKNPPSHHPHHPMREEIDGVKKATTEAEKRAAIEALRAKILNRVEQNLVAREEAIERVREKLKRLEERNEMEQANKEQLVDHHLERILSTLESTPALPDVQP